VSFAAVDKGEQRYLDKLTVEKVLRLKKGCPVMLVRNLSGDLVNGSLGEVVDFAEDGPLVYFIKSETTTIIKPIKFTGNLCVID
jgi:hypothetical protein